MLNIHNPDVDFAFRVIRQVASLVETIRSTMVVSAYTKRDLSPVTVADYAAQALTGMLLECERPGDAFIAEESMDGLSGEEGQLLLGTIADYLRCEEWDVTPEAIRNWIGRGKTEQAHRFWTLDPIDGTKGFLRGQQYAVAFALVENGEVRAAALGCPNLQTGLHPDLEGDGALILAARGQGTWAVNMHAEAADDDLWRALQVSSQCDVTNARILRSYESGHTHGEGIEQFAATLGIQAEPVRMDSQAKQALLAAGEGEFLLRLISPLAPEYKEKIWDQAAGSLIIEEAGGKITDLAGKPLDFTTGRRLMNNTGVFASNNCLHGQALQALSAVGAVN